MGLSERAARAAAGLDDVALVAQMQRERGYHVAPRRRHTARTEPSDEPQVVVSFRLNPVLLSGIDHAVNKAVDISSRTEALQDAVAVWLMMELDPDERF
jgi:hypothetical protein